MPTLQDGSPLDPKIVKVMGALKKIESGGDYNAVGDNGQSHGAYQWNKNNFKNQAKQFNLDPEDFSPANQNKVAYARIKSLKEEGKQPEEIAALWNGAKKDAQGKYTYINPEYGVKFRKALGEGGQATNNGYQTTASLPAPTGVPQQQEDKGFLGNIADSFKKRTGQAAEAISGAFTGKMAAPLISAPLQVVGAAAGGVGDVLNEGAKLIPGVKQGEELLAKGVGKLAATDIGKKVVGAGQSFADKNSELSKDIGAGLNIAGLVGGGVGGKIGATAVKGGIESAAAKGVLGATAKGITENVATKRIASTVENMSEKELSKKAGRVGKNGGLIASESENRAGKILAGKTSKNPTKTFSTIENEISTRGKGAEKYLEDNVQKISNQEDFDAFKVVKDSAKKYITPTDLKAYEEQIGVFQKILKGYGEYNTANYYKALKEYETQVTANLPKGKEALMVPGGSARIRAAKDVRKVVRDMIGKKHAEFKDKMFDLASLYEARDTVAGHVAEYAKKNNSFTNRYPKTTGLLKGAAKYGAVGLGLGGAEHLIP